MGTSLPSFNAGKPAVLSGMMDVEQHVDRSSDANMFDLPVISSHRWGLQSAERFRMISQIKSTEWIGQSLIANPGKQLFDTSYSGKPTIIDCKVCKTTHIQERSPG